ncbi:hypothetical protein BTE77_28245 [Ensifer adhaerens]|nr:hypothetical protein BTE77_28245 [Ensifer adhaerens]
MFRHFDNRRQVAAYAGLAPSPWQSGAINREQGRRVIHGCERRWLSLPDYGCAISLDSRLSCWFKERETSVKTAAGNCSCLSRTFLGRQPQDLVEGVAGGYLGKLLGSPARRRSAAPLSRTEGSRKFQVCRQDSIVAVGTVFSIFTTAALASASRPRRT